MKKYIRKQDIIVISIILLIAIAGIILFPKINKTDSEETWAEVYQDNVMILKISLDEPGIYELEENPEVQFIVNEEHAVSFFHSDCLDQICVAVGYLDAPGQKAVCLPNRVILSVEGIIKDDGVDLTA